MNKKQNKIEDEKIERLEDQTNTINNERQDSECQNCVEYKAGWQRAQADYQNLKKEIENMRGEWVRMSEQQILEDFIPVYDNFKKAFSMEHETWNIEQNNWLKGIGYIMQQFGKVLKDHNVEEIKTVGEIFNPEQHEAIGEEESGQPEHIILREVESGYMMKGKVIKVAKVIVAK